MENLQRNVQIVNFQNDQSTPENVRNMDCGVFYDEKSKKNVLAMSNGKMVYKGYRPNQKKETTQQVLVVYNKKSGTVKLVATEKWDVTPIYEEEPLNNNKDLTTDLNNSVNKIFGSKKMIKKVELYEKMQFNVESVREELERTVEDIVIDREDLSTTDNFTLQTNLPPCNREASSVDDVYELYDIIPKLVLKSLQQLVPEVIENGFPEDRKEFFKDTLEKLKNNPKRKRKISILIYLRAVSKWLGVYAKEAKKESMVQKEYNFPEDVARCLIETYTILNTNGRHRPNTIKDKAIVHCIILTLMVCDYKIDLELFSKTISTRVGIRKLIVYAKIIGLVANKDNKYVYELKIPLPKEKSVIIIPRF